MVQVIFVAMSLFSGDNEQLAVTPAAHSLSVKIGIHQDWEHPAAGCQLLRRAHLSGDGLRSRSLSLSLSLFNSGSAAAQVKLKSAQMNEKRKTYERRPRIFELP